MATPMPDHITRPDFGVSVRGYDRAQVDAYFGRVVEWLSEAENRTTVAERARESLSREVIDLKAKITMLEQRAGLPAPESMSAFSERMSQVMQSALEASQELREEAEEEAQQRRESAASEAHSVVADAREEAEKIVAGARQAQRVMEESIADLRAARTEAVDTLHDLQRRIAAVAGEPEPTLDDDVSEALDLEADTDVTTVVPAVAGSEASPDNERAAGAETGHHGDDVDPPPDAGVLVTSDPTLVQPAVGQVSGDRRSTRRRSA